MASVAVLLVFSLLNIFGIAGQTNTFFIKQVIFIVLGFGLVFLFASFDYRALKNNSLLAVILYAIGVILLFVALASPKVRGINGWLFLGDLGISPAEIIKLAMVIILSKYFSERYLNFFRPQHIFVSLIYMAIPMSLIFLQPDFGSVMVLSAIWVASLLMVGIQKKQILTIIFVLIILGLLVWFFALEPYQKLRILTFLSPSLDQQAGGYNVNQSKITIGNGGLFGLWFSEKGQASLGILPEPYNDFAFSALGEQFGFVGVLIVLACYFIILSRLFRLSAIAKDNFSRIFIGLFSVLIFSHVIINLGMSVGILPISGLPLPFISYGGSHLLTLMIGIGILQSIKTRND